MDFFDTRERRSLATGLGLLLALAAALPVRLASADSGVSDERVSLPDGPGSIGGVGENADVDPNMGLMSYQVPIEIPEGYPGLTPALALRYSSGAGTGEVGIGWSFPVSSIERMSLRGLPEYTEDDEFAVDGGQELVRVGADAATAIYRARFEGAFVRYRWHARGDGSAGHWTAEYPDGTIGFFGADETGAPVSSAQVRTTTGAVFRYYLVATVDSFGHVVRHTYVKDGEWPLLSEIGYVYGGTSTPRFAVRLAYEPREDVISNAVPGFVLTLGQRLREVRVVSGSETIRRYLLRYEGAATSGGASRLAQIEELGRGDVPTPLRFALGYSRSLDGACAGSCDGPVMIDMGALPDGANLLNGRATLIDINGDALPDFLSTSTSGVHTFTLASMDPVTGRPSFGGGVVTSAATAGGSSFVLSAPGVQVLDVDGDGFTDIISSRTGEVLCNEGSGDWSGSACLMDSTLPVLEADEPGDTNPLHVRFMDYDGDKRIDMLRTLAGSTEVYANTGAAFVQTLVDDIGAQFDESPTLQLADMNGDGLLDPVEILGTGDQLRYRLNLGFGRWTEWVVLSFPGFGTGDLSSIQIEDINGDGLDDVVLVAATEVRYAINRGQRFDAVVTLTSADVAGDLPERVPGSTTILFADMNGSGSTDIVWVTAGRVQVLELFPTQPNLLSRIENGLGMVQEIEYGTSVRQQARDEATRPWTHRVPFAMNVVVRIDTWNRLTGGEGGAGLHDETTYVYRDGYYDGAEKAFRGFSNVELRQSADDALDSQEPGRTVLDYDVGIGDPYRNGLELHQAVFGGADGATPLARVTHTYEDCPLAEVPATGLRLPVRYVCQTRSESVVQEGAPEAEWATIRTEQTYDGYGQVTRSTHHGVVHRGSPSAPVPCAPCGADTVGPCGPSCLGDELVTETDHIDPGPATGGAWQLGLAARERLHGGDASGPVAETVYHYDGEAFVGLPEGQATNGLVSRVRRRVDDESWVDDERSAHDEHGNVVASLGANGDPSDPGDHLRTYLYDPLGISLRRVEAHFRDASGAPQVLRRELSYESGFNEVSEASDWMLVVGGAPVTPRNATRYRYDAFGRVSRVLAPGDAEETPSEELFYELGDPVTRVIQRARSQAGGVLDLEQITCFDGQGREVQRRTRIADGSYRVTGFSVFNRRGQVVREHQPYLASNGECETAPPSGVLHEAFRYDALGRLRVTTLSDAAIHGGASEIRVTHLPLGRVMRDPEDSDAASPHADTPLREQHDGLGRLVRLERLLADGTVGAYRLAYDGLGHLVSVRDPAGNEKRQSFDRLGRLLTLDDPNAGRSTFAYAPNGDLVARTDARGVTSSFAYDGLGRLLAHWDPADEANTRVELRYDQDASCDECANGAGRLVSIRYPLGEYGEGRDEHGYDARGNPVFEARTFEGHRLVTQRFVDHAGRLARTVYPDGASVTRSYDGASRLVAVGGVVEAATYDARGLLHTLRYANGVEELRSFDDAMRNDRLAIAGAGGVVLHGVELGRDRLGNLTAVRDLAETSARPSQSASYAYDAWYRLRSASLGGDDETLTFAYDTLDNVLSRESSLGERSRAHVGAYEYAATRPNAVTRAGARAYTYDEAGQMIGRGDAAYVWDHAGRLVESTGPGGQAGQFLYGAGAARVAKIEDGSVSVYVGREVEVRDGIVNVYPRLGDTRLARLRSDVMQAELLGDVAPLDAPDDEINAADAWAAHAGEAGIVASVGDSVGSTRLLRGAARRLLLEDGDDLVMLHHDNLGSITLATNGDGDVVGEALYYPTGEVRHRAGFTDDHGFTGQEADTSTGLLSFEHRHLDTASGRWTSPDPLFLALTPDATRSVGEATTGYAYVGNNVVNAFDPDGLRASFRVRRRGLLSGAGGVLLARGAFAVADALGGSAYVGGVRALIKLSKNPRFREAVRTVAILSATGFLVGGPIGIAVGAGSALVGLALKAGARALAQSALAKSIGARVGPAFARVGAAFAHLTGGGGGAGPPLISPQTGQQIARALRIASQGAAILSVMVGAAAVTVATGGLGGVAIGAGLALYAAAQASGAVIVPALFSVSPFNVAAPFLGSVGNVVDRASNPSSSSTGAP